MLVHYVYNLYPTETFSRYGYPFLFWFFRSVMDDGSHIKFFCIYWSGDYISIFYMYDPYFLRLKT